ncbi:hypothetical protein BpHYR1_030560 [Brachionus plicatilis]|uniref:SUEL-type lectin domain-containing protein n=1 Tax=Brachionus plicatilis TaxID=10195 RepID=A0A3M7SRA7_BRAPC|nr:hypothetical protein BpHYR1_030560 [Brachionus plicatilis]
MMIQLGMLLLFLVIVHSAEIRSTEYLCAETYAEIKCPNDSKIVIERIVNSLRPDLCADFNRNLENLVQNQKETCIGIVRNDQSTRLACNGEQVCHLKMKQYTFKTDISEANCNFTSNYAKIFYSCIPKI